MLKISANNEKLVFVHDQASKVRGACKGAFSYVRLGCAYERDTKIQKSSWLLFLLKKLNLCWYEQPQKSCFLCTLMSEYCKSTRE